MELDLDALRAARAEQKKEPKTFKFKGEIFTLPDEMPYEYAWLLVEQEERAAYTELLGEEQLIKFMSLKPSQLDFVHLAAYVQQTYSLDNVPTDGQGELKASGGSLPSISSPSRPTSNPSTG
jgi:hypothetical protein